MLAANVDVVFVAEPARHGPDPANLGRIERLLALAWESGGTPVVLITKADLAGDALPELLAEVAQTAPGVDVHAVAARTGEGVAAVRGHIGGSRRRCVLGPSGAGKSTLVNALAGEEVMPTQQVRARDGRGRHTTVHRELIPLPGGGLIIDTPGIRRVGLYETGEGVGRVFAEVDELAAGCRFSDCAHEGEPGCAVLAAIESGELSAAPPGELAEAAARGRVDGEPYRRAAARRAGPPVEGDHQGDARPQPSLIPMPLARPPGPPGGRGGAGAGAAKDDAGRRGRQSAEGRGAGTPAHAAAGHRGRRRGPARRPGHGRPPAGPA